LVWPVFLWAKLNGFGSMPVLSELVIEGPPQPKFNSKTEMDNDERKFLSILAPPFVLWMVTSHWRSMQGSNQRPRLRQCRWVQVSCDLEEGLKLKGIITEAW